MVKCAAKTLQITKSRPSLSAVTVIWKATNVCPSPWRSTQQRRHQAYWTEWHHVGVATLMNSFRSGAMMSRPHLDISGRFSLCSYIMAHFLIIIWLQSLLFNFIFHVPTTVTVSLCALSHTNSRSTQLHIVPRHTQARFFFRLTFRHRASST